MNENINIMTGEKGLNAITNSLEKETKKTDLKTHKECVIHLNHFLKSNKLNEIVKIKQSNNLYTLKIFGRVYLLDYILGTNFNEFFEIVLKRIDSILKPEINYPLNNFMNGRQRRHYFNSKKFKIKNVQYASWFNITKENNTRGNELFQMYLGTQIKKNIEFLIDREISKRAYFNSLGYTKDQIEQEIEKWYTIILKENSFMSEK